MRFFIRHVNSLQTIRDDSQLWSTKFCCGDLINWRTLGGSLLKSILAVDIASDNLLSFFGPESRPNWFVSALNCFVVKFLLVKVHQIGKPFAPFCLLWTRVTSWFRISSLFVVSLHSYRFNWSKPGKGVWMIGLLECRDRKGYQIWNKPMLFQRIN